MAKQRRRKRMPGKQVIIALFLLMIPIVSAFGTEEFSDLSIQTYGNKSLLLFPSHRIEEYLVQRPGIGLLSLDIPFLTYKSEPQVLISPHPKVRMARVSQVSASPEVVRVSFVFQQGIEMKPEIKEGHLFLKEISSPVSVPLPSRDTEKFERFAPPVTVSRKLFSEEPKAVQKPEIKSILDQPVNLHFEQEDLLTILNALALKFNLRIYADSGVKGKFTINAQDVSLREVLKSLLLQRSFQYTLKGRDLTIISLGQGSGRMARELLFRDLSLKDALQTLSKMMNVNLILHESIPDKKVNFFVENLSLDELLDLLITTNELEKKPYNENTFIIIGKSESKKYGNKTYRTFKLINAKPSEVINMISGSKSLADKIDTTNIAVNDRINALSAYDTPENLDLIAKVIENNDEKLKQAVIELKLLEVSRGSLKQLGISIDRMNIAVADIGRLPTTVAFPATLEFLENQNKAKVLSSPKIRVVHGKTAHIHIGEQIPVPQFTYEVSSSTLNTFERKTYIKTPVGIDLTVTPEISRDNEISLQLKTTVNSVIDINKDGQIHTSDKTTDTYVRIKDGETVVLGGLISTNESNNKESPSVLNKVPLLKSILTHAKNSNQDTELIMLVTPHLVNLDPVDQVEPSSKGIFVETH